MADSGRSVRRTMELAAVRERRRRRLLLTLFALVTFTLSIGALYWLVVRDLPVVEIRNLEIQGLDTGTAEGKQVAESIEVAIGEMTTLNVKQDVLDQEMERYPRVESATVEPDFPNGATVLVRQREDGSIFGEDADALLIASDGTVLGSPGDRTDSLPMITEGDPPEGGRLDGIALDQAIVLGAAPAELRSFIDSGQVTGQGVEVTLSNGLILLFGEPGQAAKKWRAAASVIADPELSDVGYVDLSVPRRPAASAERPRGQSADEP